MNGIDSQNTKTNAEKILPFTEQTVEEVTESRKRITFGLDFVKLSKHAVRKYRKAERSEDGRIWQSGMPPKRLSLNKHPR